MSFLLKLLDFFKNLPQTVKNKALLYCKTLFSGLLD